MGIMTAMIRIVLLSVVALTLSACGWHLKGNNPLPPELRQVYLAYSGGFTVVDATVVQEIEARLKQRGANVIRYPSDEVSKLTIVHPRIENRTQSVNADGDQVQFEIITAVSFSLEVDGEPRIEEQTVTTRRDYSFRTSQLLSAEHESRRLQDDMQEELADLVMLQLEARLANSPR